MASDPTCYLSAYHRADESVAWIDVRSETEFAQSGLPGFVSLPLLFQDERSQVGLCYKTQGQAAAVAPGHQLVDPHRQQRVQGWGQAIAASTQKKAMVMCWRGGLRSQIATQWMREAGFHAEQLAGGYKRIRLQLLAQLQNPPRLLILSGMTGSGKTELLREFLPSALDLEAAARHRGSAFGEMLEAQPTQTRFENGIALGFYGKTEVLVEDESRLLGKRSIPEHLYQAILKAPMVFLESSLEERVLRIYQEYVAEPIALGMTPDALKKTLLQGLSQLRRRLDKDYARLLAAFDAAWLGPPQFSAHAAWIEGLLTIYYDRRYAFAMQRQARSLIFSGDRAACRSFLQERLRAHD